MAKKEKVETTEKGKKGGKLAIPKNPLVLVLFLLILALGSFFPAASLLLIVGMAPTIVLLFMFQKDTRIRAITIGAMNFTGCYPFLLDLSQHGHMISKGFELIGDPLTIVVMYTAAGIGYILEWAVLGMASGLLYQKALARIKSIKNQQASLIDRWGDAVKGQAKLDENGFPIIQNKQDAHNDQAI